MIRRPLFMALMIAILSFCGILGSVAHAQPAPAKTTKPKSITLNVSSLSLEQEQGFQLLIGRVKPASIVIDNSLARWKSSNKKVASVSADGYVTSVGRGSAIITCTYRGRKAKCKVKTIVPLIGFSLGEGSIAIREGRARKLKPTLFVPSDTTSKKKAIWQSSDHTVATVSQGGTVHGEGEGSAVISCTIDGVTVDCAIWVESMEYAYIQSVWQLVNKERAKRGRSALELYAPLNAVAKVRARELRSRFSHTRPDGSPYHTAIPFNTKVGENIGCAYNAPAKIIKAWMRSSTHRKNILGREYTHIGVGYHYANGTAYWVLTFVEF